MESRVQIVLHVNQQEKPLSSIPINYEELLKAVNHETGLFNFNIKLGPALISNSQDLVLAYLNHKEDRLAFEIEEIIPSLAHMDSSSQMMYQSMMDKFKKLTATEEAQADEPLQVANGSLSKTDLLRVITAMSSHARAQLTENTSKFQEKRQALYDNEEKYREVVMEQLQFQEMLILTATMDICNRFGITPDVFDASCMRHVSDPVVRQALEDMAVESLQTHGELPESLTKEKLKEVLTYSCQFLNRYIDAHPDLNPVDTVILKMRESDEVLRQFGYTEVNISSALTHYKLESDPYWADIRQTMAQVTTRLFKNQGGFPGMGGPFPG